MPFVTKIAARKRSPNRRSVYLDRNLAFTCNVNVVARFRLREGVSLTDEQVREVLAGEVRQKCFDKAMRLLQSRLHSRAELLRKLMRKQYGHATVEAVLDDLSRLGYVNDEQFAKNKALSAVQEKQHGRQRAMEELLRSGINGDIARKALEDVYGATDGIATARDLAQRKAPSLRKLDPVVARRRLMGMLQRRGFDYEAVKPVVDEALGQSGLIDE